MLGHVPREILHGDKQQYERTGIIKRFKNDVDVLIATDIASRGLDISSIRFVVNYENPKDAETYVHRIGRTGRAGNKDGVAINCLLKNESKFANILASKFEELGLAIPPDLRDLAGRSSHFRYGGGGGSRRKKDSGIRGTDKASLTLKRALESGQIGKMGLGYHSKKKKKNKRNQQNEMIEKLYGNELEEELHAMIKEQEAEEFRILKEDLQGKDKNTYIIKKKVVGGFSDANESAPEYREVKVSAAEMQKHLLEERTMKKK